MIESQTLDPERLLIFLQQHRLGVIATASLDCEPEAALVNIAVTADLEFIFETTDATRKFSNLRCNPRAELVIGWQDNRTLQCRGVIDEPDGRHGTRIRTAYFEKFPEHASHEHWPGNHYFRLRPLWVRLSDYNMPRSIAERIFSVPGAAPERRFWWPFPGSKPQRN